MSEHGAAGAEHGETGEGNGGAAGANGEDVPDPEGDGVPDAAPDAPE
jgi:hypothetical protein